VEDLQHIDKVQADITEGTLWPERSLLTIIAPEVVPATERIVEYLSSEYQVPINVVFFRYFEDHGHRYLAQAWLIDQAIAAAPTTSMAAKAKEPWNGRDWYISYGESPGGRAWENAAKYGFVSAGGGDWFSRTIRKPPVGAGVFTHIPKSGYVGVGEVAGEATPFDSAVVEVDGEPVRLADQPLLGTYESAETSGCCPSAGHTPDPERRQSGCRECSPTKTALPSTVTSSHWRTWSGRSTSTTRRCETDATND